ncbi:MAG TPA: cytochrome c3 family protein [Vicinamibacterales bacterium]|nr:cytochrome c3 family protein [Vicinamibacterales bacterium]
MGPRLTIACVAGAVLLGVPATVGTQQNPYRLKEPDQKKACLSCHEDFGRKLAKPFVHTAVQSGECSGCHDPHASSHGKLLSGGIGQLCLGCHAQIVPEHAKSVHKIVADGECQKCHDPHASDNASLLLTKGDVMCFGCHKDVGEAVGSAKFKHDPVSRGCRTCHAPHGSDKSGLLRQDVPALCVRCHKPGTQAFRTRHMNYPVAAADCTSCHDPHGSNQPAMLLNVVHAPIATKSCAACHAAPNSSAPFATKRAGFELCQDCHEDTVKATMAKERLHWAVADKRGCVNCHSPHAARHDKLLVKSGAGLCQGCHADTLARMNAAPVKHEPVAGGACTACHAVHGARGANLVDQPSLNALCGTCHDYQTHSSHPLGDKAVDPRNRNLRVDCLSCHTSHAGEYKWMLRAATNIELCTRCHKQYAR